MTTSSTRIITSGARPTCRGCSGPMQPRIFGPYEPIRRDYPIDEFLRRHRRHRREKSVYVQANWAEGPASRTRSPGCRRSPTQRGWPHAIVGYADVTVDDVRPQLDRLTKYPLMRGVRMQLHWHENPQIPLRRTRPISRPTRRSSATSRASPTTAGRFDLQVFAPQMAGAAQLAAACPKVTFVLQHAGMLEDLSDDGRAAWRAGMTLLAAQPNVVSKTLRRSAPSSTATIPAHIAAIVARDRRALRRAAHAVRLQLSDREAVDHLRGARRRAPRRSGATACRGRSARCCTTPRCASIAC